MAQKISTVEKFRLSLLHDNLKLSEIKDELLTSTSIAVPSELSSIVHRIFNRWKKVENAIRDPDTTTVGSFSNYVSYLIQEIDRWKQMELVRFNRALNVLYAEVQTEGGGVDDLIQIGSTSISPRVSGAAQFVERTLKTWGSKFPNLHGDINTKDSDAEYLYHDLERRVRAGLLFCKPTSRLFDIANRTFGGESTEAGFIGADESPMAGYLFIHDPGSSGYGAQVYSEQGLSRQVVITNIGSTTQLVNKTFDLCAILHGGVTISYEVSQLNAVPSRRYVMNINAPTGPVVSTLSVPAPGLLGDDVIVEFTITTSSGTVIPAVSKANYDGVSIIVPYDLNFMTKVSVRIAGTIPVSSVSGVKFRATSVMLGTDYAMNIMTGGRVPVGLPKIIDTIGSVPSVFAYSIHSTDTEMLWRFVRVYNSYQKGLGQPGLVSIIEKIFRRVLNNPAFVCPEDVLNFGWWISAQTGVTAGMKRVAYQQLYVVLDDHIVSALCDVTFRRYYIA